MKKLTSKRKRLIDDEEAGYLRDMLKLPKNEKTCRGLPFWNTHLASELLVKDEESGTAKTMKPM